MKALSVFGSTVYAGGSFTNIGGQERFYFAALDTTIDTNNATSLNISSGGNVQTLHVFGSALHIGGDFTLFENSVSRKRYTSLKFCQ